MSKQILISSGDYGVLFEVQLLDSERKPISIFGDKVIVNIIYPDKTIRSVSSTDTNGVTITDSQNGIIEFRLIAADTVQLGNYSIYVELNNLGYDINATSAVSYYVIAKNGGV